MEGGGSVLVLGAEGDPIVDCVDSIDLVLAGKGRGHVVIGVGVGRRASSLEPRETVLDAIVPDGVLVIAALGIGESRHLNALLVPVCAAATVGSSTVLVA